ncbi:MAG: hypothetical protein ACRC8L_07270 [Plesiomonas shigelloides]
MGAFLCLLSVGVVLVHFAQKEDRRQKTEDRRQKTEDSAFAQEGKTAAEVFDFGCRMA